VGKFENLKGQLQLKEKGGGQKRGGGHKMIFKKFARTSLVNDFLAIKKLGKKSARAS
jgi:hypothetical protein